MSSSGLVLSAKCSLIVCMWACFIWWAFQWYTNTGSKWHEEFYDKVHHQVKNIFFNDLEAPMVLWGAPPLVIAFLAILYFALPRKHHFSHLNISKTLYSIWNSTTVFPKPFGVIQLGELFVVIAFALLFLLQTYTRVDIKFDRLRARYRAGKLNKTDLWQREFKVFAENLGWVSSVVFVFLLYPVSRRSPILRILGLPYELAIKYHVWMGHTANFLSTVHGLMFWILWAIQEKLWSETTMWQKYKISNMAGVVLFFISIAMWITSTKFIRRKYFELFFYTHQLYIIYILFYSFHVGPWIIVHAIGGLFLFFLDRILRFYQSRYPVDVVSAKVLSNGYTEVVLPISQGLEVDSLGVFFLNVPSISMIQWHAFSISSRSVQTPGYISLHIKPTRDENSWTSKLCRYASSGSLSTVYVEGPYNSELTYFNRYESLILVAGGAGITPFLSVIKEVVHLHSIGSRAPENIELIWLVRNSSEIELLSSFRPSSDLQGPLNLNVSIFVTSEESESIIKEVVQDLSQEIDVTGKTKNEEAIVNPVVPPIGSQNGYVELLVALTAFFGTIFVMVLFSRHLIYPVDHETQKVIPLWVTGFIFYAALLLGIVAFTSLAVIVDRWISKPDKITMGNVVASLRKTQELNEGNTSLLQSADVKFGGRPDWNDLFSNICDKLPKSTNVGVMVCGPGGIARSVAWECQKRSVFTGHPQKLNYHGLSFAF